MHTAHVVGVRTIVSFLFDHFWMNINDKNPVLFNVRTGTDAVLALTPTIGYRAFQTYQLTIG